MWESEKVRKWEIERGSEWELNSERVRVGEQKKQDSEKLRKWESELLKNERVRK